MILPDNFNAYLFDLDNTLYREIDYLYPAYSQIGNFIFKKTGIDSSLVSNYLCEEFRHTGRNKLFNKLIAKFNLDSIEIKDLLYILRSAKPGIIRLYDDAYHTLVSLKNMRKKLAIVTNGAVEQQKNKISHIDWNELDGFIDFVFSDETERKPSPASINHYLESKSINRKDVLFIGDSMEDEQAAKSAGIEFIHSFFKG